MGKEANLIWQIVVAVLVAYLIGLMIFAAGVDGSKGVGGAPVQGDVVFGSAVVAGAAVAAVSGLLGFLFGVPRAFGGASRNRQASQGPPEANGKDGNDDPSSTEAAGSPGRNGGDASSDKGRDSWINDNLSEVSDWLTKIVVGVGLVQFTEIVAWLGQIGRGLGEGAGLTAPLATSFGVTVILLNFGIGFFVAYIFVRTHLTTLFAAAYNDTQQQLRGELTNKIEQVKRAQEREARKSENTENMARGVADYIGGPAAVLADLYRPSPKGFTAALDKTDKLLEQPEFADNPVVWGYRACALGQKYGYERKRGHTPDDLTQTADKAWEAVSRTVDLDPDRKPWLRALWNPNDPNHIPAENDLTPLYQDPEQRARFQELLA